MMQLQLLPKALRELNDLKEEKEEKEEGKCSLIQIPLSNNHTDLLFLIHKATICWGCSEC